MPMRFTTIDGALTDVYQLATQMTDESGQAYPFTVDSLLGNALGLQGYYGVFTANMHNDEPTSEAASAILDSARRHGVPVISALQMLRWLDERNSSSFTSLSWKEKTLRFRIVPGTGVDGLQAMLPTDVGTSSILGVTLNGVSVKCTAQTVKGIRYAFFPAVSGIYEATYGEPRGTI